MKTAPNTSKGLQKRMKTWRKLRIFDDFEAKSLQNALVLEPQELLGLNGAALRERRPGGRRRRRAGGDPHAHPDGADVEEVALLRLGRVLRKLYLRDLKSYT